MNIKTTTAVLAFLLAAAPARAGELSPAPIVARVIPAGGVDIKIGGILQTWYQAQRRGPTGFLVKNARVYFVVEPSSWVALNIMPAFMSATGMTLLNAFVDVKPVDHLSLRMGQFVTPFGQNRMMPPGDLEIANFHSTSRIWPGFASDLGWDVGAQAATSWKYVEARAAVINGTGPNVTKDTDTAKDLTARVDFFPFGDRKTVAGASYYHGTSHGNGTVAPLVTDKRTWYGGHAKRLFLNDRGQLLAEIISRSDDQRLWTLQGSWKFHCLRDWQAVTAFERFDTPAAHYFRRVTAGLNFWIDPRTRLTANYYNDENGSSVDNFIAQLQVVF